MNENPNGNESTCISCNRPLKSENEIESNLCNFCLHYADKKSLFEFLVYTMAIEYYMKIEEYPPKVSLKSAREYFLQMPYWKTQQTEIRLPCYEDLLEHLNNRIEEHTYSSYLRTLKVGTFAPDRYDFFISHSWQDPDDQLVRKIVQELKDSGYQIYYDRDVFNKEPGDVDKFAIKGIENSRHCILFLCKPYFTRKNTKFELEQIIKKKPNLNF
jgi:hypothetical protein